MQRRLRKPPTLTPDSFACVPETPWDGTSEAIVLNACAILGVPDDGENADTVTCRLALAALFAAAIPFASRLAETDRPGPALSERERDAYLTLAGLLVELESAVAQNDGYLLADLIPEETVRDVLATYSLFREAAKAGRGSK